MTTETKQPGPPHPVGDVDEDGLVRAILADPWDDVARSVYADWLEEQGAPQQAELLRLAPGDKGAREIVEALSGPVLASVPEKDKASLHEVDGILVVTMVLRGFATKRFGRDGPDWLRRHHIARLRIVGQTKDWRRVGNAPVMGHLRGLGLYFPQFDDEGIEQLAGSEGLASLASFGLIGASLTPSRFAALARSPHLAGLCHLELNSVVLNPQSVGALAEGPMAPSLRHLAATVESVDDAGVAVLAQSPGLANLVTLNLMSFSLRLPAVQALAGSPYLTRLRNLDLTGNLIGEEGVLALARSPLAGRLRRLCLSRHDNWPEALKALRAAMRPDAHLNQR
jgi:uncharacterized protein (TIGR02996 family)